MNLNRNRAQQRLYMSPDLDAGGTGSADRGDELPPLVDTLGKGGAQEDAQAALVEKELAEQTPKTEAEAGKDPGADVEATKKDSRIPLARHEKILQKERDARAAAERELKKYQGGAQVAGLNQDIGKAEDALSISEKEYTKLITDGETEKAAAKMAEIRRMEREINDVKGDAKIAAAVARATESARYDNALERIESQYPLLDPDHEDYDDDVMSEVVELTNGYKAQGYTPTEALQKAVRKELGTKTAAQTKAVTVAPRVDPKDVAAARRKEAAEKAISAVEATPASITKVGIDGDKLGGGLSAKAIMGMSQKEFAGLSEESLSRLRGDSL